MTRSDTDTDIDVDEPGIGLPNMPDQLAERTRFFADAAAAGSRQAVILASGLDTRAHRLDWAPGAVVYEIDQPQVLDFKAATLKHLDAQPKAGLRHVPIDLRGDWPAAKRHQFGFPLDIESLQYQAEDHDYVAHLDALGWQTQIVSPDPEYVGAVLCTSTFTGQG